MHQLTKIPDHIIKLYHLNEFSLEMKSQGLTNDTMNFYIEYIYLFIRKAQIESPNDFGNFVKVKFGYLALFSGENEGLKNSTRVKYYTSIKKYSDFLKGIEAISEVQITKMKRAKIAKPIPKAMNDSDIEKLYQMLMTYNTRNKFYNMRNYVMIEVMIYTGLRRKEVSNLKIVDFMGDHIIVREGKGQKDRAIPLAKKTQSTLKGWLEIRRNLPGEYVFCDTYGGQLMVTAISDLFKRMERNLGITIHPHLLRHSYASMCVKKGINIYSIQQAMGHADISTTSIYFHMGLREQVDEIQKLNY